MTTCIKSLSRNTCEENPSFCVLPWLHLAIRADGQFRPCAQFSGAVSRDASSLKEAWHSDSMQTIREAMLEGRKVTGCDRCYQLESRGVRSKRQTEFDRHRKDLTRVSDGWKDGPLSIDLRADNICNSGCIICYPHSSSFLEAEIRKNRDAGFNEEFIQFVDGVDKKSRSNNLKSKTEMFSTELRNLEYIYIAGGEPFLSKRVERFLLQQIESGLSKKQTLKISTNLTTITMTQLESLAEFKEVELYCSIDAVGTLYEYIRYPCKWDDVATKLEMVLGSKSDNVLVEITPTLSAFNLLDLVELFEWRRSLISKYGYFPIVFHSLLKGPEFLCAGSLPSSVKEEAIEKLEEYRRSLNERDNLQIDRIIRFLQETPEDVATIKKGQAHIEAFDSIRGNSWRDATPYLSTAYQGPQA